MTAARHAERHCVLAPFLPGPGPRRLRLLLSTVPTLKFWILDRQTRTNRVVGSRRVEDGEGTSANSLPDFPLARARSCSNACQCLHRAHGAVHMGRHMRTIEVGAAVLDALAKPTCLTTLISTAVLPVLPGAPQRAPQHPAAQIRALHMPLPRIAPHACTAADLTMVGQNAEQHAISGGPIRNGPQPAATASDLREFAVPSTHPSIHPAWSPTPPLRQGSLASDISWGGAFKMAGRSASVRLGSLFCAVRATSARVTVGKVSLAVYAGPACLPMPRPRPRLVGRSSTCDVLGAARFHPTSILHGADHMLVAWSPDAECSRKQSRAHSITFVLPTCAGDGRCPRLHLSHSPGCVCTSSYVGERGKRREWGGSGNEGKERASAQCRLTV